MSGIGLVVTSVLVYEIPFKMQQTSYTDIHSSSSEIAVWLLLETVCKLTCAADCFFAECVSSEIAVWLLLETLCALTCAAGCVLQSTYPAKLQFGFCSRLSVT